MSPALQGGFLTTEPPGKASRSILGPGPGRQAGRKAWGSRWAPCWLTHQGGHGKADDLEVAIIVPLRLEVVVLPRVAPGHGARTVPGGDGTAMGFRGRACRTGTEGLPPHPSLLTWGCSGKQYTGASGPESWGSGLSHHTAGRDGRRGLRAYGSRGSPFRQTHPPCLWAQPAHHHADVLGQVLGAAHQEVGEGCLWETEGVTIW